MDFQPTPDQEGLDGLAPLGSPHAAPAKLSPSVLMDKSLPLPKDASMHLRKLARHPCQSHVIYSNDLRQLPTGMCRTGRFIEYGGGLLFIGLIWLNEQEQDLEPLLLNLVRFRLS